MSFAVVFDLETMFVQMFDAVVIALTDMVIASLPVALPIIGIMIAVRIAISFFGLLGLINLPKIFEWLAELFGKLA